jgi:hypothetical protein
VTIPEKDQAVMLWLQEQMNMSYSIRTLIKRHIIENGGELVDVTCESLDSLAGRVVTKPIVELDEKPKARRGRPAKKENSEAKTEETKIDEPKVEEPKVTEPKVGVPKAEMKPEVPKVETPKEEPDYSGSFDFSGDFGAGDMDISDMLNI